MEEIHIMKIALAQMEMEETMERNLERSIFLIEEAAKKEADLICFPEIQLSRFFPQYEKKDYDRYAINMDSIYVKRIQDACKENHIYAVPNFYIKDKLKKYDMSLLIDNHGQMIGKQKMVHIAQVEQFYEQDYYTPSEEGFQVFDTPLGRIGIVICFDQHYPESIRTSVCKGADLIIIPTANTKAEPVEMFAWEVKVQAFQNSVNIAMCNRVGTEGQMEFSGQSLVCDYNGETIAIADDQGQLLLADINLADAKAARNEKPYCSLRRPELYV